jgi:cytochrome c oxidase cbb3-type subunit 3
MRDVESTPALVAAGRTSFQPCAACHGEDARGRTGQGPALNSPSFLAAASDDFLRRTILHGRAGTTMPPWPSLEGEAVSGIIAYLRSLAETEPAELNEGPLNGDVEAGGQVFASICAGCHGRTGAGYQETSNGTGIGRRAFLSDVSNGFLRYIIENGKTETQMHGFAADEPIAVANLTHDEIENVIAYLRANAW